MLRSASKANRNVQFAAAIAAVLLIPATAFAAGANIYIQHNLVSDIAGNADVTDPNLVNPWGVSQSASSPFWISRTLG